MEFAYLLILGFLFVLAVFDLFVGVSNDAVNFLNSAIGAKAAKFKTVVVIASVGIALGAVMSAGMMDIARHGVMNPSAFSFHEVMIIFFAVMATDVIILDLFNTAGLPTSTTVSLVFELLGATFAVALLKSFGDPAIEIGEMLNSDKALQMIIAIFVSVAIAFVCGMVVQYVSRLIFTFNYKKKLRYTVAVFGGLAFTIMAYFIFIKGVGSSPFISIGVRTWIDQNTGVLLAYLFVGLTALSQLLHMLKVDIFRIVVLVGTFGLAMAFAGNDLVNFIGVPMAGLSSIEDWMANGNGDAEGYMMHSLMGSAQSPLIYLLGAGIVMIIAMATSKKAKNVLKTSIDLSRQDDGDEMFGSSYAARNIVRASQNVAMAVSNAVPRSWLRWIDSRFDKRDITIENDASFDMVRAAINLVLASGLIVIGTIYKLPLSTTYVTFMVAMGSSLADRAWSRESAVFRVTGVISVIGGWFITAAISFVLCAVVATTVHFGGFAAMIAMVAVVITILVRSHIAYAKKETDEKQKDIFRVMMHSKDAEIVRDMLVGYVGKNQSEVVSFVRKQYQTMIVGLQSENLKQLRLNRRAISDHQERMAKTRRKEYLALKRTPDDFAMERNTWFHLAMNSNQQMGYCLKRMLDPAIEHVDNMFNPMPQRYTESYGEVAQRVIDIMIEAEQMMASGDYARYKTCVGEANACKSDISQMRKDHIAYMQQGGEAREYKVSLLYLNMLQETQELLSIVRRQLRATKKFAQRSDK